MGIVTVDIEVDDEIIFLEDIECPTVADAIKVISSHGYTDGNAFGRIWTTHPEYSAKTGRYTDYIFYFSGFTEEELEAINEV